MGLWLYNGARHGRIHMSVHFPSELRAGIVVLACAMKVALHGAARDIRRQSDFGTAFAFTPHPKNFLDQADLLGRHGGVSFLNGLPFWQRLELGFAKIPILKRALLFSGA